jgi:hypothetical protein
MLASGHPRAFADVTGEYTSESVPVAPVLPSCVPQPYFWSGRTRRSAMRAPPFTSTIPEKLTWSDCLDETLGLHAARPLPNKSRSLRAMTADKRPLHWRGAQVLNRELKAFLHCSRLSAIVLVDCKVASVRFEYPTISR